MPDTGDFGLGRLPAEDERDRNYLMASAVDDSTLRPYRFYSTGKILDQGSTSSCVGHAWRQWLSSALMRTKSGPDPFDIYYQAQRHDEWPGEDYDGTSVRAGAKVLQTAGHISTYVWAFDAATMRRWLLNNKGTVVVGTWWFEKMFVPDGKGYLDPSGTPVGGHAYLVVGFSQPKNAFRIVNSWGSDWGQNGRAWVRYNDMDFLVQEGGEACTAVEKLVG